MGDLINIFAEKRTLKAIPENVWRLRWKMQTVNGVIITSSWTPEVRYPSIRKVMHEFAGQIDLVSIEGRLNNGVGKSRTFLEVPGYMVANLSYKAMLSTNDGVTTVVGIEVLDIDSQAYLVLRDGTLFTEERKVNGVSNDN